MLYLLLSFALAIVFAIFAYDGDNKVSTIVGSVVVFLIFGLLNFFGMPILAIWGQGLWFELLLVMIVGIVVGSASDYALYKGIAIGIYVLIWIIVGVSSSKMTNSGKYNRMIDVQEVEYESFATDIDVIPVDKMIVVDHDLARKVVEDRLEEDPGLGSRCCVGNMTMQNLTGSFTIDGGKTLTFDNDQIWVAPLEHHGFWKWLSNDVTPGYMLVYANDAKRSYLITEVNGKKLRLRYLESACFGEDIERHVRTSGYASQGLTEHNFEIDENGRPYWVLCNYEPTIGIGGYDTKGIITVDIQTGMLDQYTIEDAPAWVDHIQPAYFVAQQISWWGEFKSGWWNSLSIAAQEGVQVPTPGMVLVYSNGQSYWYTGVRSAGGDDATSGFMLINSRTKEAKYYRISGPNEQEAQRIVEDQNFAKAADYRTTAPVLYNVRGVPTYFMTLKGTSGNVTGYAFMAVTNRQAVGVGTSKREAETNYLHALRRTSDDNIIDGAIIVEQTQNLTVRDITKEGEVYYILFQEVSGKEFTGSSEFFRELRWTKAGHKVSVSYGEGDSEIVPLDSFDNLDFAF